MNGDNVDITISKQTISNCFSNYNSACFFFALSLLIILTSGSLELFAQESLSWLPEDQIPGYDPQVNTPYLIADQNQTIHAFNSTNIEGDQVIVYSQWTKERGWTDPIDILLPQLRNQIRIKGAVMDQAGVVHLLFFSGADGLSNVYYTNAPLLQDGVAYAWSKPKDGNV